MAANILSCRFAELGSPGLGARKVRKQSNHLADIVTGASRHPLEAYSPRILRITKQDESSFKVVAPFARLDAQCPG